MIINGVLCCAIMWALLGLFSAYRFDIHRKMGSSDEDSQWSFGQVLALATWAPVAVELIDTYLSEYLSGFIVTKSVDDIPNSRERCYRG